MPRYYNAARLRRQSAPVPPPLLDARDITHLVPATGHARFRTSLCGVLCAEGRLTHERETHGRASSTLAHVECAECLRLTDLDAPVTSSELDNREAPTCACGAPVYADDLCVAHHEQAAEAANRALPPSEQRD